MGQLQSPTDIPPIRFREMTEDDIPVVHAIERLSFKSGWSKKMFRDELSHGPTTHYFVAEIDDDRGRTPIIGYGGAWFVADECHIVNLAVQPQFRGHRIGVRILLHLIDVAMERGMKRFTLEVRAGNQAAIRLYEKFGFIPVAIRRNYYKEENEDAMIMWIHDAHDPGQRERLSAIRKELNPADAGNGN